MQSVSWSSLRVVAADGLVGDRGVALRTPVLREEGGRLILPENVDDEVVTPKQVLRESDASELLKGGIWISVNRLQAARGRILVLRGASFARAVRTVGLRMDLHWVDCEGRIDMAYVDRSTAVAWRAHCAERFMRWAERRIGEHLALGDHRMLADTQVLLEQTLFVTDPGTPARQHLFVLLGVATAERSPVRWPALAAAAIAESPGLDRARLDEQVEAARQELRERKERASFPSWATTGGPRLRPASL